MMVCGAGDGQEVEDLQLISLDVSCGGAGEYPMGSEERTKVGRHPRWSRPETLVLIEAKKMEDAKWSKVREERERGIETARNANSDSKWLSISQFCETHGVVRSPAQCRKRWCNLSADYKRIRDWQSLRTKPSFWLMSNDVRKDSKLPGCFDREVFDSLDNYLGKHSCVATEIIFDSGRVGADEGLFSDIENPFGEGEISVSPKKELMESPIHMESPPIESPAPTPGTCEEKFSEEKFTLASCEEKPIVHSSTRRKRKRPSEAESDSDDFKGQLFTMLESNKRVMTAQVESQNINSQLDRNQRKEHAQNLVGVLGRLAEALGRIAEKL